MIWELRYEHKIGLLIDVADIPRSTYYYYSKQFSSPNADKYTVTAVFISTHASAREATSKLVRKETTKSDFNSRLRTGGDTEKEANKMPAQNFNSRLRTGGDEEAQFEALRHELISTHASAREATRLQIAPHGSHTISTHASAREATG